MIIGKSENRPTYTGPKSLTPSAKPSGLPFQYRSRPRPNWKTTAEALAFAETVRKDRA